MEFVGVEEEEEEEDRLRICDIVWCESNNDGGEARLLILARRVRFWDSRGMWSVTWKPLSFSPDCKARITETSVPPTKCAASAVDKHLRGDISGLVALTNHNSEGTGLSSHL